MKINHKNTAFVLVGGFGTRLKTLFPNTPKPLVPLGGEVFLKSLLNSMHAIGINNVVLLTGYKSSEFDDFVRTTKVKDLSVSVSEETKPLGSAGAVALAYKNLKKKYSDVDSILVVNGDTWYEGNLKHFIDDDFKTDYKILLSYKEPADRYGLVELDESSHILAFKEKQESTRGWVHSGFAILSKKILDTLYSDNFSSLEKDVFNNFKGYGHKQSGNFFDFGIPEDYFDLNRDRWLQRLELIYKNQKYQIINALETLSPIRINNQNFILKDYERWASSELTELNQVTQKNAEDTLDAIDTNLKKDLDKKVVNPTLVIHSQSNFKEKRPALFLDRDGTLIDHIHYLREPKKVKLLDQVSHVLKSYKKAGYRLIVVTNQSGIGREYFNWDTYKRVNSQMNEMFLSEGVEFDWTFASSYYEKSNRWIGLLHNWQRKPFCGMSKVAELAFHVDLKNSIMVGDSHVDAGFAHMSQLKACYWINGNLVDLSKNPKEFSKNNLTNIHFVSSLSEVPTF